MSGVILPSPKAHTGLTLPIHLPNCVGYKASNGRINGNDKMMNITNNISVRKNGIYAVN